jgi:hypothetical protein
VLSTTSCACRFPPARTSSSIAMLSVPPGWMAAALALPDVAPDGAEEPDGADEPGCPEVVGAEEAVGAEDPDGVEDAADLLLDVQPTRTRDRAAPPTTTNVLNCVALETWVVFILSLPGRPPLASIVASTTRRKARALVGLAHHNRYDGKITDVRSNA